MKKTIILFITAVIILLFIIFLFIKPIFTGKVLFAKDTENDNNEYSYTKAICNDSNFCQDYEIKCRNKEIISQMPITGAAIQHPADWKDPRNSNELC